MNKIIQVNNRDKSVEESTVLRQNKKRYPRKTSLLSTTYQQNVDKLISVFTIVCKLVILLS